jgi:hypothetical protein
MTDWSNAGSVAGNVAVKTPGKAALRPAESIGFFI